MSAMMAPDVNVTSAGDTQVRRTRTIAARSAAGTAGEHSEQLGSARTRGPLRAKRMAIDVKEAVELAVKNLTRLLEGVEKISFEEFEILDGPPGHERMEITLSFELNGEEPVYFNPAASKLAEAITGVQQGPRRLRHFRIFSIDAETGRIRSMKIRKLT